MTRQRKLGVNSEEIVYGISYLLFVGLNIIVSFGKRSNFTQELAVATWVYLIMMPIICVIIMRIRGRKVAGRLFAVMLLLLVLVPFVLSKFHGPT